jgi:hypothetical protein
VEDCRARQQSDTRFNIATDIPFLQIIKISSKTTREILGAEFDQEQIGKLFSLSKGV